jgi:arabinosaccharide transport system substrate-binding protein
MQFHLGKAIAVMLILAGISGTGLLFRPREPHADLTLWVFAESHRAEYQRLLPGFGRSSGKSVRLDLVTVNALNVRLASLFMSPDTAEELPDAAEIEINSIGRYFRPPVKQIGFLPLNQYLQNTGLREIDSLTAPGKKGWNARFVGDGSVYTFDGRRWAHNPNHTRPDAWIDRISRNRFAPWTKDGLIFGVPHDVHPVTITYRADLFGEAGVNLESARTWSEFQDDCLRFQQYWRGKGFRYRHAMKLSQSNPEDLFQLILQQHLDAFDASGGVTMNDPRIVRTLAFYAQLVAGPRKIGAPSSSSTQLWAQDLESGNLCAMFTPDWEANDVRRYAAGCAGKVKMMPLPRFDEGDARTSTWGGTMIGIPRASKHPEDSWKLIETLYLSPSGLKARSEESILPPLPEQWDAPAFHRADPFFSGQDVMGLYADLADEIPPHYVTPATPLALAVLSVQMNRAVEYVESRGVEGLDHQCRVWLDGAAAEIQRRIEQARFD